MPEKNYYCSPYDYIHSINPKFAAALNDICVGNYLTKRTRNGLTFLYPDDATIDEIIKLVNSGKYEDGQAAEALVSAHIIKKGIPTEAEWGKYKDKDTLANALQQIVEVKSAEAAAVTLNPKLKIVKEVKYKELKQPQVNFIWKLSGGKMPVNGKPFKATGGKTAVKEIKGAYDAAPELLYSGERQQICINVENIYAAAEVSRRQTKSKYQDIFLNYSLSLCNFLMNKDCELFCNILPALSLDKTDFYILVEPHNYSSNYLVPTEYISEWWKTNFIPVCGKDVLEKIQQHLVDNAGKYSNVACYSAQRELYNALDSFRDYLVEKLDLKPTTAVAEVEDFYKKVIAENKLPVNQHTNEDYNKFNAEQNDWVIFPEYLVQYWGKHPGLKLSQDDLKFFLHQEFETLEQSSEFNGKKFSDIVNMIGDALLCSSGKEIRSSKRKILNDMMLQISIDKYYTSKNVIMFSYSTAFMSYLMSKNIAESIINSFSEGAELHKYTSADFESGQLYNIMKNNYETHERIAFVKNPPADQVVSILKSLNISALPDTVREELKKLL